MVFIKVENDNSTYLKDLFLSLCEDIFRKEGKKVFLKNII